MPDSHLMYEVFGKPSPSSTSLGFQLLSLDMKALTTRVRFDGKPEFCNPAGVIQGGYLVAMMDDTIGMLAGMKAGKTKLPSTVDLHTHFLRPVRKGAIEVAARLRNVGRAIIFADAELYDSRGKEAARASASLTLNPVLKPGMGA
ncbi:MAG: PaaI family thioesterase [Hyphomonas sp.]|nr:PaaI family thioesterase [Hyphomonas sp.]